MHKVTLIYLTYIYEVMLCPHVILHIDEKSWRKNEAGPSIKNNNFVDATGHAYFSDVTDHIPPSCYIAVSIKHGLRTAEHGLGMKCGLRTV